MHLILGVMSGTLHFEHGVDRLLICEGHGQPFIMHYRSHVMEMYLEPDPRTYQYFGPIIEGNSEGLGTIRSSEL